MKCPDCGSSLSEVSFGENERAMRCFRCGGFWIDSETANKLSALSLSTWRRISVDPVWLKGGKGTCPMDGTILTRYVGEVVPPNITAMRCVRCGKWWFPGDNLFAFKPALDAKMNYLKMWRSMEDMGKIGLPVAAIVLLVGGVYWGVKLVGTQTQNTVPAAGEFRQVAVSYLGEGQGLVTFETDQDVTPGIVKYRTDQNSFMSRTEEDKLWTNVEVTCDQGKCQGEMYNLEKGITYILVVGEKEYKVFVKN